MILDTIFNDDSTIHGMNIFQYNSKSDLNSILSIIDIYYTDCVFYVDKNFHYKFDNKEAKHLHSVFRVKT